MDGDMIYLFTREQIESCILRPGQRANPESFVLISENPPKLVTGDEYNKMLDDEMTTA
jgi:hypothetical protein